LDLERACGSGDRIAASSSAMTRSQRLTASIMTAMAMACATFPGCGEGPPTAPGPVTTITLTISPKQLPFNGTAMITADLVDGTGRPAANGTIVTFTTTLGSFESASAETMLGRATVTFHAGTISGTATINATAPNAATAPETAGRIAIGAAAASRVLVIAEPPSVPFSGGSTAITATVLDGSGKPLASIPVTFSSTAGTLTANALKTDQEGNAMTTLRTSLAATVTAAVSADGSVSGSVGNAPTGTTSVTVAPRPQPTVSVTPSPNPTAGAVTTFTISVAPAANSGTGIQNLTIAFGDGARLNLGAASGTNIVVQHVYEVAGTYTVSVTAVDTAGASATASSVIIVAPAVPMTVAIEFAPPIVSGGSTIFTFVATVQPATVMAATYQWNFGDGSASLTTNKQIAHTFRNGGGPYTVQVTVTSTTGQIADTFVIINP
jgi:hypothetical protein